MDQVLGAIGAAMILGAFWALQTRRLRPDQRVYQLINLGGAIFLSASAIMTSAWSFLVLNGTWGLVALWALLRPRRSP